MANRRMFSLDVVDTDKFLDMPISAQCLYFHLGMRADDDGFISSPRQIMRMTTCTQGDMRVLVENGFIIPFESGIVVIRHWRQNNYVRCDRYTKSIHVEEMNLLTLENGAYNTGMSYGIPIDIPTDDTDKNRLDKNKKTICSEPDKSAPNPSGILIILNDKSYYDVPLEKITMWKATYPAVNVEQELRKMGAWCDSNPTRRKTRRGIEKFINNWLSRTQDSGGTKEQKGECEPVGNNTYNTDAEWERVKRAIDEAGNSGKPREEIFT